MLHICFFLLLFLALIGFGNESSAEEIYDESVQSDRRDEDINDKPWRLKPVPHKDKPGTEKTKKKGPSFTKQFNRMARDLLGQPHWSDRFSRLLNDEMPKIAVHPFEAKDIPISLAEAQVYQDGVTRALIREAGDRYAIVGRSEMGALVEDISNMGTRTQSYNPLGALFDRAQSDLLAIGSLALSGKRVILTFKLVETETGRIVSSSQRPFKRVQKEENAALQKGLSVEGAAQDAVETLMRDVYEARKIMVQGIRYQTSGAHSPFGRYFMGLLADQLRMKAASGPRNLQSLDVSEFIVEEEIFRGLTLKENGVEKAALQQGARSGDERGQDYLLKGTYWVFENHVEVRLNLIGRNQSGFSWRGDILKSEIPENLTLIPPEPPVEDTPHRTVGPIDLYLSSNKGENPDFKLGETMSLVLKVQENAYVYCYYLQADGRVLRILPNRFLTDAQMPGGFVQHIPSSAMPFEFEIAHPLGVEAVKCFATDQDLERDLSGHFKEGDFNPLSIENERELIKLYRDLTHVNLSEATLILTTHQ